MRLWSLHPKYLDTKGLVALWRETLLAKHVLEGKTKGYKNHPQLIRFKNTTDPVSAIHQYLETIYDEASSRGYNFNISKFNKNYKPTSIVVTTGQVNYEVEHLLNKLKTRDPEKLHTLLERRIFTIHPIFKRKKGEIEDWEIITDTKKV